MKSFTLPAVVLSGLVAGLLAWPRRKRHRCISAHCEVLSEKQTHPIYHDRMSFDPHPCSSLHIPDVIMQKRQGPT